MAKEGLRLAVDGHLFDPDFDQSVDDLGVDGIAETGQQAARFRMVLIVREPPPARLKIEAGQHDVLPLAFVGRVRHGGGEQGAGRLTTEGPVRGDVLDGQLADTVEEVEDIGIAAVAEGAQ